MLKRWNLADAVRLGSGRVSLFLFGTVLRIYIYIIGAKTRKESGLRWNKKFKPNQGATAVERSDGTSVGSAGGESRGSMMIGLLRKV